jgi:prepilin-type N-terminal cleavage/methylation domain-containing protein
MNHRQPLQAAFTLVELMVVVAIIGVLSAMAVPLLSSHQLRTKSSEGKTNLGAIRVAEQIYFSEYGRYLDADPEPADYHNTTPVDFALEDTNYALLGWAPEGRVYFSYSVGLTDDEAGYTATAFADIDGDQIPQVWGYVKPNESGVRSPGHANAPCYVPPAAEVVAPCLPIRTY